MALIDSLISYWKLDEASGDAVDAHGSNTLTDVNTCGTGTGKINGARDFVGVSSEYLTIADNVSLSFGDDPMTVQAWVKLDDLTSTHGIFGKWASTGAFGVLEYCLRFIVGTVRFTFVVRDTAGTGATTVTANNLGAPVAGNWYCMHCWHDPVANEIGISGNAGTANTTAQTVGIFDGTGGFSIGRPGDFNGQYHDGLIDEVAIWDRVLSSTERTELYNAGAGLAYPLGGAAAGHPATRRLGLAQSCRPVEIGREGAGVM